VCYRDFEKVVKLLDSRRQAAEEGRTGDDELVLAGQRFLVLSAGAKVGTKRAKAYLRWQLQSESGYVLQLMNRRTFEGTMPNAKLVATSLVMMQLGIEEVTRLAFEAIRALRGEVGKNKVSRIDVCCDLPDRKIEPLKLAFDAGHVVCRADSSDEHGEELSFVESDYSIHRLRRETTSFNLGRSDVRLRIYEKVRECRHDLIKLQVLIERRWGVFPYRAIRVEYQLRRGKLKMLGVDSLADWLARRAAIVRYLCHQWFRITDGPYDPKHPDRTPILPEWREVQEAFAAWTGDGPCPELKEIPSQPMPPEHFTKSIVGLLVSLLARTGVDVDSNETFAHEGMYRILDEIEDRDMVEEVRRRRLELGIADRSSETRESSDEP
jgi:hypothetical protein